MGLKSLPRFTNIWNLFLFYHIIIWNNQYFQRRLKRVDISIKPKNKRSYILEKEIINFKINIRILVHI